MQRIQNQNTIKRLPRQVLQEQSKKLRRSIYEIDETMKEKFPDKNIWCYTGFDFEKDVVGKMVKVSKTSNELVRYLDVVVDGKFEEDKKNISLTLRGSTNQRIINVKETLKENKLILFLTY